MSKITTRLDDFKAVHCSKTGEQRFIGSLKSYTVTSNDLGVFLRGSIAKYLYGNSTQNFADQENYINAIENISDSLKINLKDGKISRVDFGQNLIMDKEIKNYYPLLLRSSYLERVPFANSLYFKNNRKALAFYNKNLELKNKGIDTEAENLLRYELRLLKKPHSVLNTEILTVQSLAEKEIYLKILNRWYMEYHNIQKTTNSKPILNFKNAKEMKNMLALYALMNNEAEIIEHLEQGQKQNIINKDNAYKCRLMLARMKEKNALFSDSSLLDEINKKMEQSYKAIQKTI